MPANQESNGRSKIAIGKVFARHVHWQQHQLLYCNFVGLFSKKRYAGEKWTKEYLRTVECLVKNSCTDVLNPLQVPQFFGKNISWKAKLLNAFVIKTVSTECARNNIVQAKTNIDFFLAKCYYKSIRIRHTLVLHMFYVCDTYSSVQSSQYWKNIKFKT